MTTVCNENSSCSPAIREPLETWTKIGRIDAVQAITAEVQRTQQIGFSSWISRQQSLKLGLTQNLHRSGFRHTIQTFGTITERYFFGEREGYRYTVRSGDRFIDSLVYNISRRPSSSVLRMENAIHVGFILSPEVAWFVVAAPAIELNSLFNDPTHVLVIESSKEQIIELRKCFSQVDKLILLNYFMYKAFPLWAENPAYFGTSRQGIDFTTHFEHDWEVADILRELGLDKDTANNLFLSMCQRDRETLGY